MMGDDIDGWPGNDDVPVDDPVVGPPSTLCAGEVESQTIMLGGPLLLPFSLSFLDELRRTNLFSLDDVRLITPPPDPEFLPFDLMVDVDEESGFGLRGDDRADDELGGSSVSPGLRNHSERVFILWVWRSCTIGRNDKDFVLSA